MWIFQSIEIDATSICKQCKLLLLAFDERLSKAGHALLCQSFLCQRWVNVFGWYSVRDLFWYQRCNKILRNFGPSSFSFSAATAMSNCSCPTSEKLLATPNALHGFVCWLLILCGRCHMALPGIIILLKFCLSFREISLHCFVVVAMKSILSTPAWDGWRGEGESGRPYCELNTLR